MKVTFDRTRILHLLALVGFSWLGGHLLVTYLEWSYLSAFGLSVTLVCQCSNVYLQLQGGNKNEDEDENENDNNNFKEPKSVTTGGNPKKKKSKKFKAK